MRSRRLIILWAAVFIGAGIAAGVLVTAHQRGADSATGPPPSAYRGSQPPKGITVPDIALRSYRGPLVRTRDLRGKVVAATFLDTACRDKCPIITAVIGAVGTGFNFVVDEENFSVLADVKRPAIGKAALREHAVTLGGRFGWVAENGIVGVQGFGKRFVALFAFHWVHAGREESYVEFANVLAALTERFALRRSATGEGFRKPSQHDPVAP